MPQRINAAGGQATEKELQEVGHLWIR